MARCQAGSCVGHSRWYHERRKLISACVNLNVFLIMLSKLQVTSLSAVTMFVISIWYFSSYQTALWRTCSTWPLSFRFFYLLGGSWYIPSNFVRLERGTYYSMQYIGKGPAPAVPSLMRKMRISLCSISNITESHYMLIALPIKHYFTQVVHSAPIHHIVRNLFGQLFMANLPKVEEHLS